MSDLEVRQLLSQKYGDIAIRYLEQVDVKTLNSIIQTFPSRMEADDLPPEENEAIRIVAKAMYDDIVAAVKISWIKSMPKETLLSASKKNKPISPCSGVVIHPDELAITWYAYRCCRAVPDWENENITMEEAIGDLPCMVSIYMVDGADPSQSYLFARANWDGNELRTSLKTLVPLDVNVLKHEQKIETLRSVSVETSQTDAIGQVIVVDVWVAEADVLV